jgi:hypothetical protein
VTPHQARTVLASCLLLTLPAGLASCSSGTSDAGPSAREAEADYTSLVEDAVTVAGETIGASKVELVGRWDSCLGAHQFRGTGSLTTPRPVDPDAITDVLAAMVEAGFSDTTQVEGHASVERGEVELDVQQPTRTYGPRTWTISFNSDCRSFDDEEYIDDAPGYQFEESSLRP